MKKFWIFFGLIIYMSAIALPILCQPVSEKVQQGITLLNQGNVDGAAALFQEVVRTEPNHGPARFLLGQIAMERYQWNVAEEHLKIAVGSNVRRPDLAWQMLGKLQLLQHRYPEALESFSQALQRSADFEPALIASAQTQLFLNDPAAAVTHLEKTNSAPGVLLHAEVLVYLGREADAKQRLQGFRFNDASAQQSGEFLLAAINQDREADNKLRSHISRNLGDARAYLALAILEQRKRAVNPVLFEIAFQLDDQNAVPLLFLKKYAPEHRVASSFKMALPEVVRGIANAGAALKEKQWKQARELAGRILAERPFHIPAELILIEAAEQEQNFWEALERYTNVVSRVSGIPSLESRVANLASKMGAYGLAECHGRIATKVQPQDGYLHHVLAEILHSQKKTDEAIKEAQSAVDLGFQDGVAYVLLGNLYYEKMEISKSIAALSKALEIDPHAAEEIASFALSALTAEDYQHVRKILETHVKANPENVGTLYSLAIIYLNENQLEIAKQYLMKLEKLAPERSQIHYNLGLVNFRSGKEEEGRKAMDRFQELKEKELKDWTRHNEAFKTRKQAEEAFKKKSYQESIRLYSDLAASALAETGDLIALAQSYAATKKNREAFEWFEKALKVAPYNREALAGAAEAAKAIGEKNSATLYSHRSALISRPCS